MGDSQSFLPRITLPVGTPYRQLMLRVVALNAPPETRGWPILDGPFRTLAEVDTALTLLPLEFSSPVLVSWVCSYKCYMDAEGYLHFNGDYADYPHLGVYDFGSTENVVRRRWAHWLPEGIATDYEPERTAKLVKALEAYEPAQRLSADPRKSPG
jgi:hypothetical protein